MKALIPMLLMLPLLSSCDTLADLAAPQLTAEQQAIMDDYEARIDVLQVEIKDAESAAFEAIKNRDISAMDAAEFRLMSAVKAQRQYAELGSKLLNEAKSSKMSGFMRLVEKIPGPWQPLIPLIGTIATVLMGRRSRKFAWVTVRDSLKVGLLDTLRNARRSVGMEHSSEASKAAAISDPSSPIEA